MSGYFLTQIESLKNMLVATATGGTASKTEYKQIRSELISNNSLSDKLPDFINTCRSLDEFWGFIQPKISTYRERREFLRLEFHPILLFLEQSSHTPSDSVNNEKLIAVDSASIQTAWHKALERRVSDPEGAITSARTLLEAVCKHILEEENISYQNKDDLPKLYSIVAKHLNLSPSQHTEELFKQILGGCHSVVQGLGALRNSLSDAHARGKTGARPLPRHAELAVNLAGTMATFILSTWEQKQS
ncbi:MAG: abortive infection family protein [Anaerohalosphaera sp.]|nr:abortive infection family protein [Anaerohalosphaera sp.]